MLQSMGSQRAGHNLATEQQLTCDILSSEKTYILKDRSSRPPSKMTFNQSTNQNMLDVLVNLYKVIHLYYLPVHIFHFAHK